MFVSQKMVKIKRQLLTSFLAGAITGTIVVGAVSKPNRNFFVNQIDTTDKSLERILDSPKTDESQIKSKRGIGANNIGNGTEVSSSNFFGCIAVIIDYGKGAIFAHCYSDPQYKGPLAPGGFDKPLNPTNIVKEMTDMLKKDGIPSSDCFAAIYSGSQKGLEIILKDLKEQGIDVRWHKAEEDLFPPRDVSYNAEKNELNIHYDYELGCELYLNTFFMTLPQPKEYYLKKLIERGKKDYTIVLENEKI